MGNDLHPRVTAAIDSMRQSNLDWLDTLRDGSGAARFSVDKHGQLTVLTGPLKRDNFIVRLFKGLRNPAYRERDAEIKLAQNVEFQRRITEKAMSLSGRDRGNPAHQVPNQLSAGLRRVLTPGRPSSSAQLPPEQLRRVYESSVHIENMMKWGESLAWHETPDPSGQGLIRDQLADAPEDTRQMWRQMVTNRVSCELRRDAAMAGLMEASARELAEQGSVASETLDAIRALVQRKTAEVLKHFSAPLSGGPAVSEAQRP